MPLAPALHNQIIVRDFAANRTLVSNPAGNFAAKLAALGFAAAALYFIRAVAIALAEHLVWLIQQLIQLGALFSAGKEWSPLELLGYYHERGIVTGNWRGIAWTGGGNWRILTGR